MSSITDVEAFVVSQRRLMAVGIKQGDGNLIREVIGNIENRFGYVWPGIGVQAFVIMYSNAAEAGNFPDRYQKGAT